MNTQRAPFFALAALAVALPLASGCGDCYSEKRPGSCTVDTANTVEPGVDVPVTANSILKTYCYNCHGQGGTVEGGMNYVLDVDAMVANGKLVKGDASTSRIYQRMADGSMPPAGVDGPTEAEIALIKLWIDEHDAEPVEQCTGEREFITNDELFTLAATDLNLITEEEKPFIRYVSFAHLYNSGVCDDQLDTYRIGLSKLVNHLSWVQQVTPPAIVDENKVLYRLDLRDYRWTAFDEDPFDAWEYAVSENPYAYNYGDDYSNYESLRKSTRTRTPIVNVDWFVNVASQPPLYHEILDIPTNLEDFLSLFGVDAEANIANYNVVRAGFKHSGVSFYNRLLERHESLYGYCWVSYDFAGDEANDNKSLCDNPIDPEYDGGEMICSLPNHMQIYYLANAVGERFDVGPDTVVNDPNRAYDDDLTSLVVNGLSCNNCHYAGIIPKADQIAGDEGCAIDSIDNKSLLPLVELLYGENGSSKGEIGYIEAADSEYFLSAVDEAAVPRVVENPDEDLSYVEDGLDSTDYLVDGEPIFALVREFDGPVDLARAMAEVGLTEDEIDLNDLPGALKNSLEDLDSGLTISRKEFLTVSKELICYLQTGEFDGEIKDGASACDETDACGPSGLACLSDQVCITQKYEFIDPNDGDVSAGLVTNGNTDNDFEFGLCANCPADGSELENADEDCSDGVDNDCDGDADSADSDCP